MESLIMTKEYDTVLEAKRSVKAHIAFFESILEHLKGPNKQMREHGVYAAWALHRYINDRLMDEIKQIKQMMMENAQKQPNCQNEKN
jgi:hypothetical protein